MCTSVRGPESPPVAAWEASRKRGPGGSKDAHENRRKLNGTVSKILSRITGRTIADEAREPTLNVMMRARDRRWNWLDHILCVEEHQVNSTSTYELRQETNPGLAIWRLSQT